MRQLFPLKKLVIARSMLDPNLRVQAQGDKATAGALQAMEKRELPEGFWEGNTQKNKSIALHFQPLRFCRRFSWWIRVGMKAKRKALETKESKPRSH